MPLVQTAAEISAPERWIAAVEASVEGRSSVELIETATSWVMLTERHAYKVKKPVDLGEARYRAPLRRRQACLDELWLNRRLAPDVYLGVVPFVHGPGHAVRLGGEGAPIEWAVKMRRLRTTANMLLLLKTGELTQKQVDALAGTLANFYFGAPPQNDLLEDFSSRVQRRLEDHDLHLSDHLPGKLAQLLRRIRAVQSNYLRNAQMVFNLRMCDGRIVDGHGDLRPEHIFLDRAPSIIDCVEYSAGRRKVDALDDVSALAMECRRHGRPDVAEAIVLAYRIKTGDDFFPHLEAFYRSVHACSRAKALVLGATGSPDARLLPTVVSYLELAEHDVRTLM